VVVDLWWGAGALCLLPDSSAHQALIFAFLVLMAGGHASSYAAHPPTVLLGVLALVLPMIGWLSTQGDTFHRAAAFAGALYLAAIIRSIQTLSYFFGRSHRLAREVQVERDRAEKLARTDFLTELNNRRAFYEIGEALLRQTRRYVRPAALVMLDVDHFKRINDRYGHAAGDAVICAVAALIREHLRDSDVGGRLGGEEFAVLLPETALGAALSAAERLRAAIEAHAVSFEGDTVQFTVSLGVAAAREDELLDALIARADEALYRAKHSGRNSVEPAAASSHETA
jgi:diguanylate cyclase (GGDEF)-like protein